MKIYIGPFKNFVGPYQIAEKLLFWMDKDKDDRVHDFGTWLAGGEGKDSLLTKFCQWIESKRHRKVQIRIDKYDTWNMDGTLAPIILPMLKQLKATKHGAPFVNDKYVPKELRSTVKPDETNGYVDNTHFQRWDWVLDEIIWAFEQLQPDCDWEAQYTIQQCEIDWTKLPEDEGKLTVPIRWKTEGKYDWVGMKKHSKRIDNGLMLFGVHYRNLWD